MKKHIALNFTFSILMFAVAICMFMQASNGGGLIFLDKGIGFEPKDLGLAILLLAFLIMPFWLTAMYDFKNNTHSFKYAPAISLLVLFIFPLPFEGRLWSEASFPDGKPMFEENSTDRVKSWDYFFGYEPLWRRHLNINPAYLRYETTDLGTRLTRNGNYLWSVDRTYGLNKKGWLTGYDAELSDKVYECLFDETQYLLGFYWRDSKLSEMEYWTEDKLPKDKCQHINRPNVGAEIAS
jgi:hypothetical protein